MEKPAYYYVYILQSKLVTDRFYTGFTENIENRLKDHNSEKMPERNLILNWAYRRKYRLIFRKKVKSGDFGVTH